MKKLLILFVYLGWSHIVTSQEYQVFKFGEGLPKSTIGESSFYNNNSYGFKEDFPRVNFRRVNENRIEIYSVDKFGVEDFEPIIIKKVGTQTREEMFNNLKRIDNERLHINRR